jgi:hypothetical protein
MFTHERLKLVTVEKVMVISVYCVREYRAVVDRMLQLVRFDAGTLVWHGLAGHSQNSPVVASRHVD